MSPRWRVARGNGSDLGLALDEIQEIEEGRASDEPVRNHAQWLDRIEAWPAERVRSSCSPRSMARSDSLHERPSEQAAQACLKAFGASEIVGLMLRIALAARTVGESPGLLYSLSPREAGGRACAGVRA
jgi:hypothetical protein